MSFLLYRICLDEKHKLLIGDIKNRIPMKPGSPEK
jgi:hypothetical protein